MQLINNIISVINDWVEPFVMVAPYQENPPDYVNGYATIYPITSSPQTTIKEKASPTSLELSQLMSWVFGFSFYKYMSYGADEVMPITIATKVRHLLNSLDAMKSFNKLGIDIAPVWNDIMVDTYRDSDRNKYVQNAHFEVKFYFTDKTIIESEVFEKVEIVNYEILQAR